MNLNINYARLAEFSETYNVSYNVLCMYVHEAIASAEAQARATHCQNGRADVCLASQRDGVVCPDDECDIDGGMRHDHTKPAETQAQGVGEVCEVCDGGPGNDGPCLCGLNAPPSAPVGVDDAAEDAAAIDKAWDRFNAALAQQPAAEAQGGGEVVARHWHEAMVRDAYSRGQVDAFKDAAPPSAPVGDSLVQTALRNLPQYISKSGLVGPDKHSAVQCFEVLRAAIAQQPAPSAPVGVEGLAEMWRREAAELVRNARDARASGAATVDDFARADRLDAKADGLHEAAADLLALAQQPAACPRCDGTGEADSGGIHPWGAPAMIRCECQQPAAVDGARPLDDWHEDDGPVVWWKLPVDEPAWIGTPLDSDWPGYHTHWTPHPAMPALAAQPGGAE